MTTTQLLLVLFLVLAAAAAVIGVMALRKRERRAALQRRFGPEYERALEEQGRASAVERELSARAKRVRAFQLRELNASERAQFANGWTGAQARFVDDPSLAVRQADELIKSLMQARGYPVEDFDQRVADLSVDHANVVQHYRAARSLAEANRQGRANTEELRQAFVHYRALFADLLEEGGTAPVTWKEAHA
jgi:hypothetical protein